MTIHTVTIPGEPVAYARTRTHGRQRFKPTKHRNWEAKAVALMRAAAGGEEPLEGPLWVEVEAVYPRPKNIPKRLGTGRRSPRSTRSDLDNVVKLALDAAVKAGWCVDDNHIAHLEAWHYHAAVGEDAHVVVRMGRGT